MQSNYYFHGADAESKAIRFADGHSIAKIYIQPGRVCVVIG